MVAIGNNLVIIPEKIDKVSKTEGGLLLTDKNKEDIRYQQAEVYASAVDYLKTGDKIYYDKNAGHKIEVDNTEYTVIKVSDVVIVL